jgi:hypothetical protein
LDAALARIHSEHRAAEQALAARLEVAARARRRTLLDALRTRRKTHVHAFRAAGFPGIRRSTAPESISRIRGKFRRRRQRRPRHKL